MYKLHCSLYMPFRGAKRGGEGEGGEEGRERGEEKREGGGGGGGELRLTHHSWSPNPPLNTYVRISLMYYIY